MMSAVLEQVFSLLTTELGGLVYHLVLAFSIAGALQLSLGQGPRFLEPQSRRARFGLILLLVLQLALFAVSGLVWQGVFEAGAWLPPLARVVDLLSLVLIVWLWLFPSPSPSADAAALLVGLLVLTVAVLGVLWWTGVESSAAFNRSPPDIAAGICALLLLLLGCLGLVLRRPPGWGSGLSMLGLLATGVFLHLILPSYDQDYPSAIRLVQMAAYPFLLALPARFTLEIPGEERELAPDQEGAALPKSPQPESPFADPLIWKELQSLAAETEPGRLCNSVASMLVRTMDADLCLLLLPPDEDGNIAVQCGYDSHRERYLESSSIESRALPMLAASMRMGRPRRLSASGASPDLDNLANLLNLERTGGLLFVPVLSSAGAPVTSVVLLAPFSGKEWSSQDGAFLATLSKLLVHFLQRSREMADLRVEIDRVQRSSRRAGDRLGLALEESQKLRDQLAVIQEKAEQDQARFASVTAMVSSQTNAQAAVDELQAENQQRKMELAQRQEELAKLEGRLAQRNDLLAQRNDLLTQRDGELAKLQEQLAQRDDLLAQRDGELAQRHDLVAQLSAQLEEAAQLTAEPLDQEDESLDEELRMALEEVSFLSSSLAEAERKIADLEVVRVDFSPSDEQFETIFSIARDLRQPLSSIVGYTDFLLSEAIGILGKMQRKYLERIKVSTERLGRLVDDLSLMTSVESNPNQLNLESVDLITLVDSALQDTDEALREKKISLNLDLPSEPLVISTDQRALRIVLVKLLRNASSVTPNGGDVSLGARLERSETDQDYILLQVGDSGEGIAALDLPRVFSPRPAETILPGVGSDGADLPNVKTLVEVLGGRIWVDSEPGQGATFSVLLPVSQLHLDDIAAGDLE